MRRVPVAVLAAMMIVVVAVLSSGCGDGKQRSAEPVEVFGPQRGVEADLLVETLKPFTEETGIQVRYVGSGDFVSALLDRSVDDVDPPDVAIVPQPGVVRQLAESGKIVPLSRTVRREMADNYPPALAALGRVGGKPYGVPYRLTIKSLVWYRPAVFEQNGWKVPRTSEQLTDLVEQISEQPGIAPWCFSIAAGTSTGWPATDWVEDLVLRREGSDVYREWATGEVSFSDPRIAESFQRFQNLVLRRGRHAGDLARVVETPVAEAVDPMFANPPRCAMLKQGDFAANWMPEGTPIGDGKGVKWFVLPGESAERSAPLVIGGDQAVQFTRSKDADALMAYLAGPEAGISWVRRGGFISPKSSIPEAAYPAGFRREMAAALDGMSELGFDASDQMSAEVGSDLLWRRITEWVSGAIEYPELARTIDAARARERREAERAKAD